MRNTQSTLLYSWFKEVWNDGIEESIDKLFISDGKAYGIISETESVDAEGFKAFYKDFKSQFHNIKIDVEDVISEDDMEAARTTVNAVHTASGNPVIFTGMCIVRKSDGKIIEAWNNYDFLSMNNQIEKKLQASDE